MCIKEKGIFSIEGISRERGLVLGEMKGGAVDLTEVETESTNIGNLFGSVELARAGVDKENKY